MNHRSIIIKIIIYILLIPLILSSCSPRGIQTYGLPSPILFELSPTYLPYTPTNTIPKITPSIEAIRTTMTSTVPSTLPYCLDHSVPKGTLLFTVLYSGIYAIDIGCQPQDLSCVANIRKVFNYEGFIAEAIWSPFGKAILFAANIGSPPLPPNTGGMVSEMRLFSIPSTGGSPMAISSHGGFVSTIDSCKNIDRIVYQRNFEDKTKIFIVDTLGKGSSFTHEDKSVFGPSCSSEGQYIAFLTMDDQLFIKHIGNSIHTFISNNVNTAASWSPDDKYLSFITGTSPSDSGTCIALTNLDSSSPPQILSPCPIPGLGYYATWSPDGKYLLSNTYPQTGNSKLFVLSEAPSNTSNSIVFNYPSRPIFETDSTNSYSIWIGPSHIIIIEDDNALVVNINQMCVAQTFDIPKEADSPDWFLSK